MKEKNNMLCCSCKKYIKIDNKYLVCEVCGGEHHSECAGEEFHGTSNENSDPREDAYSICERCLND